MSIRRFNSVDFVLYLCYNSNDIIERIEVEKMKMKKIIIPALTAVMLCACSTATQEVETMSKDQTESVISQESSELDKDSFASGIKTTEEESSEKTADQSEKASEQTSEKESGSENGSEKESVSENESESETEKALTGEITERCPSIYTATRKDVTYGSFTHGTYESKTCNMERGYSILLPADYSEDKEYPVLYLLHGIFGNEYSFSSDSENKIKEIVGNMAADGIIEETIVVCPNMFAATDPSAQPGFSAEACLPYDNFINDLVNDLMPYIESEYSVKTGRENTYLAGFSMGGRETIFITLQKPELFGYVCAISAAPGIVETKDKFMSHPGQLAESDVKFADGAITPNVFILCCGSRDSVVGTYPKSYHELLAANGADHIWYEISGADHDNNAIRSGLYNLFNQIAYDKAEK